MTEAARKLLEDFESLPDPEQIEVAREILRRAVAEEYEPLSDRELVTAADSVFLELDRQEGSR